MFSIIHRREPSCEGLYPFVNIIILYRVAALHNIVMFTSFCFVYFPTLPLFPIRVKKKKKMSEPIYELDDFPNLDDSDLDDFEDEEPGRSSDVCRRSFLLTLSQVDTNRFPNPDAFACMVVDAFNNVESSRRIIQWACCAESHADGGVHFHMSIKLSGSRWWDPIRKYLSETHGVNVNFSETDKLGYVAAYRYVCKDKPAEEVVHSPNHDELDVIGSPKTKKAMKKNHGKTKSAKSKARKTKSSVATAETPHRRKKKSASVESPHRRKKSFVKRLQNPQVSSFIVKKKIKTVKHLHAVAKKRKDSGETDLRDFITKKSPCSVSNLVAQTWSIEEAPQDLERMRMSRMDIVKRALEGDCRDGCNGRWFQMAVEILTNNDINVFRFAYLIRRLLERGRQKFINLMLVGGTNCGKTFLLSPLEDMFKAFVNPAVGRYAWIGLDEAEVAFLNDFRWTSETIEWNVFLLLLEGATVHLPRPKNQYPEDMTIERSNTIPFFATSKVPIRYPDASDLFEQGMMDSRWEVVRFFRPVQNPVHFPPCVKCFAKLVMSGFGEYNP